MFGLWSFLPASAVLLSACQSQRPPSEREVFRGLEASERYVAGDARPSSSDRAGDAAASSLSDQRVAAMVGEHAITWADLRPILVEASGGLALEEVVLNRLVESRCASEQIVIEPSDLQAERARFIQSLVAEGVAAGPDEGERLLQRVRSARGLGDARFDALLRRTAGMRKLVQPRVQVTPAAVEQAYQLRYGPRYRVRIITVDTARSAGEVCSRLARGEEFSALAARESTDASRARGGVIDLVSPADPTWPVGLRKSIEQLAARGPGSISDPIALDRGYAIVILDEIVNPAHAPPLDAIRAELEGDVRSRQERLYMNELADQLLAEAGLAVLDPALERSWRQRRGED